MDEARYNSLKVVRWHSEIKGAIGGVATAGPIRANLDLTNLCNHGCSWCEPLKYREGTIKDKRHTLETERAIEVLDDLALMKCRMVHFSGGGEPLLHDNFGALLKMASGYEMRTFVVTNGTYLDEWMNDIWHANHVRVSLDSSNAEEHQMIHGGKEEDFARIISSVRMIAASQRGNGQGTEIGLGYVLTDENCSRDSLLRILLLAKDIGVDYIQFRPVSDDTGKRLTFKSMGNGVGQTWDLGSLAFWIHRMQESNAPNLKVLISGARESDVFTQREFEHCYAALTVAVIGATGDVQACCDERLKVFGNVYKDRLRNIWQSGEHRKAALAIDPRLCHRCLMCGYNKAVESYVVRNDALVEFV